jgi:hypothetical protein
MEEEVKRDLERAEEYEQTTARASAIGKNKFELSTGLIIAARYADKLRRVALVTFSKLAPKDIVIRDVAELNKQLYDILVNQYKIGKLDVVRITVEAEYDDVEKKIKFDNIKINRYYTEEECRKISEPQIEELKNKINKLSQENEELKNKIKEIKEKLASVLQLI